MQVDVKDNIAAVLARIQRYKQEVVERAVVSALNRCVEMARTDASRELRSEGYNIKAGAIKAAASVRKAASGHLVATLSLSRKPIALIAFGAKQRKDGVSVKVHKAAKTIKGAFIATMPSGHTGVYVRKAGGKYIYKKRNGRTVSEQLPIRELYGPSVGGMYGNARVQAAVQRSVAENFERRLTHELKRLSR